MNPCKVDVYYDDLSSYESNIVCLSGKVLDLILRSLDLDNTVLVLKMRSR